MTAALSDAPINERARRAAGLVLFIMVCAGSAVVAMDLIPRPTPELALVPAPPLRVVSMLAGSELRDLLHGKSSDIADSGQPTEFERTLERETGIQLKVEFTGSLSGAEKLAAQANYDVAWFASDAYLRAIAGPQVIHASESIMKSPVLLGVKRAVAIRYGWHGRRVSWREIQQRVDDSDQSFSFAMTNPAVSNSGLAALVGAVVSLTHDERPSIAAVERSRRSLAHLLLGVNRTAGSSGFLSDKYVDDQAMLSGLVNYESELLALQKRPGVEPLELIYPSDGVVVADYPLLALRDPSDLEAYARLAHWLKGRWAQQYIVDHTDRRRADGTGRDNSPALEHEIAIPRDKQWIDSLLNGYLDKFRKPACTTYLIDTSTSMGDQLKDTSDTKLGRLKRAFKCLAQRVGTDECSHFARFVDREEITMMSFSDTVDAYDPITIDQDGSTERQVIALVDQLGADGRTALYDALFAGYERLSREVKRAGSLEKYQRKCTAAFVLLTDGEPTTGRDRERFIEAFSQLDPPVRAPVFAIHLGDENAAAGCGRLPNPPAHRTSPDTEPGYASELCPLVQLTGGKIFEFRNPNLLEVMKEIRGYQ